MKMNKFCILLAVFFLTLSNANAQKFGYVDTDYILKKIPAFKTAQDQLNKLMAQYQLEVDNKYKVAEEAATKFQSEKVLLTDDLRQKRQADLLSKEKEAKELQRKYFSPDGLVAKRREDLLKPIQDKIYTAIKDIAADGGYATIFDVSNNPGIIYNNPKYDLSDKVLDKMGFRN